MESIPNRLGKKSYVQGFDCGTIDIKNMLTFLNTWKFWKQYMKMLYNFIVLKTTRSDANHYGHSRQKIVKASSSKITPIWVNSMASASEDM